MKSKLYYTINEVATKLDIPHSTIRHWEREIGLLHSKRTGNIRSSTDDRRFTPSDVLRIRVIKALIKKKLFTIPGAKKELIELDLL